MRVLLTALCLASPATAWEFSETTVCTLTHESPTANVTVTFDPAETLYTITLRLPDGTWSDAPAFRLRFDGPRPLIIGTDRHTRSADGRDLSVSDSGFGNVLDGIQYNAEMTALVGPQTVSVSTMQAADAVALFRECPTTPTS